MWGGIQRSNAEHHGSSTFFLVCACGLHLYMRGVATIFLNTTLRVRDEEKPDTDMLVHPMSITHISMRTYPDEEAVTTGL